jgi:hypothetical protein
MVPVANNGLVAQALGRYTTAFRNQPNCKAIMASLLGQVGGFNGVPITDIGWAQRLENIFWQIIQSRILANSPTGDQLDEIGGLLVEPRQGRIDSVYLQALLICIRINRSQGCAEDVIQVANLVFPGAGYHEYPIMSFVVEAYGLGDASGFARQIGQTKAIGSRGFIYYSTTAWPASQNLVPTSRRGAVANATCLTSRYGLLTPPGFTVGLPVAVTIASPP